MAPRITAAMCARGRGLAEPRVSPDGTRVAFVALVDARAQLVVVPVDGGAEVTVTADPPPIPVGGYGGGAFDWAGSDALVYAGTDGKLWKVPGTGGPPVVVVDKIPASCPAVSPDGGRVAFLADDSRHVGLASLADGAGWPERLSSSPDFSFDPTWSPDGSRVAWHEWTVPNMPWDGGRIMVWPGPQQVAGGDDVCVAQPRFAPDGSALAFLCDAEGWLNLWIASPDGSGARPLLKEEAEHGGPSWGPGQRSYAWSPDARRIAFCRNERGFGRLCVLDVASGEVTDVAKGEHGALSWVGDRLVAVRSGARTPTQIVSYRVDGGFDRTVLAVGPVAGFDAADLPEPEPVEWEGEDGGTVHGRLYRPKAPPDGLTAPPLILYIHGGPTGQTTVQFVPRIAFWVDRGWAVLMVDYRGSTGWGRAYAQALRGRWGELDVSDCAAGMRAAAERGWCDRRRMVPYGGSAGGFTVLLLLALHPDLCAAGVDLYGVTDLLDLAESTHRFEAHYLDSIVGPLPETADRYRQHSPVTVADRIQAPLLILQGREDKAVPPAQSESIAERLRALGRDVEIHLYDGEGHGWRRPESVQDELERTESFLRRHVLRWRA